MEGGVNISQLLLLVENVFLFCLHPEWLDWRVFLRAGYNRNEFKHTKAS